MSTWLFLKEKDARGSRTWPANETLLRQQAEAGKKSCRLPCSWGKAVRGGRPGHCQYRLPRRGAGRCAGVPIAGRPAALQGRWGQAVQHFNMLLRVDLVEAWKFLRWIIRGRCRAGRSGDAGEYRISAGRPSSSSPARGPANCRAHRQELSRRPADESVLAALAPLAELAAKSFSGTSLVPGAKPGWRRGGVFPEPDGLSAQELHRAVDWGRAAWRMRRWPGRAPPRVRFWPWPASSWTNPGSARRTGAEREMIENKYREGLDAGNGIWILVRLELAESSSGSRDHPPRTSPPTPPADKS